MKIWTIQKREVIETIEKTGEYFAKDEEIPFFDADWKKSYDWLTEKMREKLKASYENIKYPVWGWYIRNGLNKKPDLRLSEYGNKGEKLVCIELDIPDDEVLLSDFDNWHFVLNGSYFDFSIEDEDQWDELHRWLDTLSDKDRKKEIRKSWDGVLNIEPYKSDWQIRGFWVQATFWKIKKEYIKKVQYFTAR